MDSITVNGVVEYKKRYRLMKNSSDVYKIQKLVYPGSNKCQWRDLYFYRGKPGEHTRMYSLSTIEGRFQTKYCSKDICCEFLDAFRKREDVRWGEVIDGELWKKRCSDESWACDPY